MVDFEPEQLLQNPDVVTPVAPWCSVLKNLDLGIVLLAQPWIAGEGLRRGDLERDLRELTASLPIGSLYFQRISRTAADLEKRGILRGKGVGRERKFVLTPQGFASLILNLYLLQEDPTLDGSEFELKRELVAMWNLTFDRVLQSLEQIPLGSEVAAFFEEVDRLTLFGKQVITAQTLKEAFSVLRLVATQREKIDRMKSQVEARAQETQAQIELLRAADLSKLDLSAFGDRMAIFKDNPALMELVRGIATSAVPTLSIEAQIMRYEAYLEYLNQLERAYRTHLKVVDISKVRRRLAGREH
jgi:hypothetical protein